LAGVAQFEPTAEGEERGDAVCTPRVAFLGYGYYVSFQPPGFFGVAEHTIAFDDGETTTVRLMNGQQLLHPNQGNIRRKNITCGVTLPVCAVMVGSIYLHSDN
jgi:hypothetical protein